jgi:hypothetical protein
VLQSPCVNLYVAFLSLDVSFSDTFPLSFVVVGVDHTTKSTPLPSTNVGLLTVPQEVSDVYFANVVSAS